MHVFVSVRPPLQSHQGKAVENVHTVPISCCYMTQHHDTRHTQCAFSVERMEYSAAITHSLNTVGSYKQFMWCYFFSLDFSHSQQLLGTKCSLSQIKC